MAVKKIETLNKHQNPATNENEFDIENYMNVNWDKIKEVVDNNADELTTTQRKVTTLETDNTKNKQDISDIKENQTTQNDLLQRTQSALINITTEKSSSINVQDSSNLPAKVNVFGNSTQNGEPTPETPVEIQNVGDNINLFNKETATIGARINYADGTTTNNNGYTASDYIEVEELEIYYCNYTLFGSSVAGLAFYDKNKTFLSGRTLINQITAPLNARYIRFCFRNDDFEGANITDINTVKFEKGNKATSYSEYGCGNIDITVCNKNFFDENDTNNFKYGVGDDFTTKNDDGTFKTIANFSLGRNKGTKIVGLKANTDYIVSLDIKNITSTATSKAAEVEIIENAEKISIVMQKDFKNLGINTFEFNSGSYQDLSLHISGYTYSEVSKSVSVTFADVLIAEKSNDNSYIAHEEQLITFPLKENQKMYESSRTEDDGIHHKRKQIVLMGNEQIVKYTKTFPNGYGYRVILNDVKANTEVLSSIYPYEKFSDFYWADDITNKITTHNEVGGYVLVGSSKATIEEFRQEIAGSVLEYETIEETIEEYTEEQQTAYNQLQSAKTYKTVTNVFTENAEVEMEYIAHTKTYVDNEIKPLKEQINTINQLLSTTNTSALLLDNLQTDLESEVL